MVKSIALRKDESFLFILELLIYSMGLRYINRYNFKCPIVQYVQYTLYIPQFSEIKQQKLNQNMMIEYTVPGIAPPEWSYLLLTPHVPHQEGQPA